MNKNLRALLLPLAVSIPFSSAIASTTDFNSSSASSMMGKDDFKYSGPMVIKLGTRVDYQRDYQKSELIDANSGFKGNNLMISIQGNITERFSYRYRQRIHQKKNTNNFFDGTDYMWLQYNFNDRWDVRAGRVAIEHGSAEYQRDPSEQYILSDFYNYPACYLFGLNVGFNATPNDRLVAQAAESSFRTNENTNLYSYALSWYGNHNWFHTMYSANMTEYRKGKFVYYLSLGNQFNLSDNVLLNIDYQNRFTDEGDFWKDCTVRGELMVRPNEYWNIIGLGVYSSNQSHDLGPLYLTYGTELTRVGGIVEFMPIPKVDKLLKVHAGYSYCWGNQNASRETPSQNRHLLTIGVQWEMDVVGLAKKMLKF